ncbi:probable threonine protease PRSS50 [Marmota flaviventris]|uniref:probable threonine protease PRSS50 n=1 Tax=Marmota flaviventris TaxID=93162 RepID=UPI000FFF6A6B|nr:probable threonine protease PRSS50 [Marmota flaviventris]
MQPWWWTAAGWQEPQDLRALLLLLLLQLLSPQLAGCSRAEEPPGAPFSSALSDPGTPSTSSTPNPTNGSQLPPQSTTASSTQPQVLPPICGFSYEQDPTLRDPEAMTRRWPWMVSVRANGIHVCSGTLIASRWVLAVAHCLTQHDNYTVMVGSPWIDQITPSSSNILVLQVIVHRRFRSKRYWSWIGQANNIGLLKLQKKLKYNKYVRPVCLPGLDYALEESSLCTVTGWGSPQVNGSGPQFQTIQEKEVVILNSKECDAFYHSFSRIPSLVQIINSQMICVKDGSRENFCYETTGEPLVCSLEGTWYLVGMTSWGPGCNKSEAPPIFLKVSAYQAWIWDSLMGKSLALPTPSRALLLVLPLPLSLLATL